MALGAAVAWSLAGCSSDDGPGPGGLLDSDVSSADVPTTERGGDAGRSGGGPSAGSDAEPTDAGGDGLTEDAVSDGDAAVSDGDAAVGEDASPGDAEPGEGDGGMDAEGDGGMDAEGGGGGIVDWDFDGVLDVDDNCVFAPNPGQEDLDGDGIGDACEPDSDSDGVIDDEDNCVDVPNASQDDFDGDGQGDACEPDSDDDGVPDQQDLCPDVADPDQFDSDDDGIGNACEPDGDGDGIPDDLDPSPGDGDAPALATPGLVYAHTSSALFEFDIDSYEVTQVGGFGWPPGVGLQQMTDIAIDQFGVIYGVSFDQLYVVDADDGGCSPLGALPGSFNGLTWVPAGVLDPALEVLVGISTGGAWFRLDVSDGVVTSTNLGSYGPGYSSAGDAYSIAGVGTYAAVNKSGSAGNWIVDADPATGSVLLDVGETVGYSTIYGLAGWTTRAFAFVSTGEVLSIVITKATVEVVADTPHAWWGAGIGTVLPTPDALP